MKHSWWTGLNNRKSDSIWRTDPKENQRLTERYRKYRRSIRSLRSLSTSRTKITGTGRPGFAQNPDRKYNPEKTCCLQRYKITTGHRRRAEGNGRPKMWLEIASLTSTEDRRGRSGRSDQQGRPRGQLQNQRRRRASESRTTKCNTKVRNRLTE